MPRDFNLVELTYTVSEVKLSQAKKPCRQYVDVTLQNPSFIQSISFANFYASHLTLKGRFEGEKTWRTFVHNFVLMENPHYEDESLKVFSIDSEEYCKKRVEVLRFYTFQDSPNWKSYGVRHIVLYGKQRKPSSDSLPQARKINEILRKKTDPVTDTDISEKSKAIARAYLTFQDHLRSMRHADDVVRSYSQSKDDDIYSYNFDLSEFEELVIVKPG